MIFKYSFPGILALILCFPCLSFSQPFIDIINLRYQSFTPVNYIASENRQMSINQPTGSINLPVPLKSMDVLITGITYDKLRFTANNTDQRNLYSLLIQAGYLKTWNGKWKTLFLALPRLNSDQLVLTKDALQPGGVLLFTYVKSEYLKYKFGLYYNREFFGHYFIPLAGIEWRPSPRINAFGVLPANMNIEYRVNKMLYTGFSWQSITSSYRMHDSDMKYFVRNGDRFWGHNQVRMFINSYLTKNIVFFTEAGYTVFRKFEAYVAGREKTEHPVFAKTKNGTLLNAGIAYRIRLDANNNN